MSPILHIIHDIRMADRLPLLLQELERQSLQLPYHIWHPVEDARSVVRSINLSHKQIVRWARDHALPEVIIMEDDCSFPSVNGLRFFLDNKPARFDIYAAATYMEDQQNRDHLCGFHLYIVSERFYDSFLATPEEAHIDTAIDNGGGEFKVCRPFAALQAPSWSANNRMVVNYNKNLKPEDIYR